jgi:hypothetical protein
MGFNTPSLARFPPTPYFVEGVAPRDSGGKRVRGKAKKPFSLFPFPFPLPLFGSNISSFDFS